MNANSQSQTLFYLLNQSHSQSRAFSHWLFAMKYPGSDMHTTTPHSLLLPTRIWLRQHYHIAMQEQIGSWVNVVCNI